MFLTMSSSGTILICDDEPHIRHVVAAKLRSGGFEVYEGRNGREGLVLLGLASPLPGQIAPATIVPSLIITDLQMPQVSGLELAQGVRDAGLRIPVIMLTARGYILSQDQLDAAGIREVIAKPFGVKSLMDRVNTLIGEAGQAAAPSGAEGATAA
jgi:two-component system response regulator MprA